MIYHQKANNTKDPIIMLYFGTGSGPGPGPGSETQASHIPSVALSEDQ
jgi:hypothetical protein